MSVVDLRELTDRRELEATACVVGAGIAGVTVARRLADAGIDVLLLESGGSGPEERTQTLHDLTSTGYPIRENFMSRARYLGGSCNLWAGRSMRLKPGDVEPGPGASSSWPIPYAELERHYPAACDVLGLPDYGEFDVARYRARLSRAERLLLSAPLAPTVSLWATRPARVGSRRPSWSRRFRSMRLLLHANVVGFDLRPGSDRSVEAVRVAALDGPSIRVRACVFVLACGGIENARLLLLPIGDSDTGLGNRHDQAGRFFMDHPRAVHGRVRLAPGVRIPLLRGRPLPDGKVQIGIALSEEVRRREGLLHHYATLEATHSEYVQKAYESAVHASKVLLRRGHAGSRAALGGAGLARIPELVYLLAPREILPHWLYRVWVSLRDLLRRSESTRDLTLVHFCEQPPLAGSRVALSNEKDELGVPRVELHWQLGDDVVRSLDRLEAHLADRFESAGLGTLTRPDEEPRFTDASHHMGTTRMSAEPSRGVVDVDARVHGVRNLYVAGSSVFPRAGHANPTLTLVALALRLGDHLVSELARGD